MTELWSFDLDGILAEPPFGWNPAVNRNVSLQPYPDHPDLATDLATDPAPAWLDFALRRTWYRWRYVLRPPRRGAIEAMRAASQRGRVIVLTGRHERGRDQTESWLERHGFGPMIDELIMNGTALKTARYKEAYLRMQSATLHIDDDAATVALLARNDIPTALVSWPRNRGLAYPPGVTRCDDMDEVRALIERWPGND